MQDKTNNELLEAQIYDLEMKKMKNEA